MKTKPTARLDKWATITLYDELRYCGIVSGHRKLSEGEEIFTSKVEKISDDGKTVETRNTIYTLGEFSQELQDRLAGYGISTNTPDPNAN